MSAPDDGGPAFPVVEPYKIAKNGMTLRDYFAAKVMAVYMMPDPTSGAWTREADFGHIAATAYKAADALLKARAL